MAAVINSLDLAGREREREFSSVEEEEEEPSLNQRKVHVSHPRSRNLAAMRLIQF